MDNGHKIMKYEAVYTVFIAKRNYLLGKFNGSPQILYATVFFSFFIIKYFDSVKQAIRSCRKYHKIFSGDIDCTVKKKKTLEKARGLHLGRCNVY